MLEGLAVSSAAAPSIHYASEAPDNQPASSHNKIMHQRDHLPAVEIERLKLRCVRHADASRISELMTEPISRTLAAWPIPFTQKMAEIRIVDMQEAAGRRLATPFAVELRETEMLIGWVGITCHTEFPRCAKLGYWIGEPYQGRGYAKEAAVAAVAAAFEALDIEEVEAFVEVENTASCSVLRACRMNPIGERMIFAPARNREHLCTIYRIARLTS